MKPAHKLLARQIAALAALTCVPFVGAYLGACSSTTTSGGSKLALTAEPSSAKVGDATTFVLVRPGGGTGSAQLPEKCDLRTLLVREPNPPGLPRECSDCATGAPAAGRRDDSRNACVWTVTWKRSSEDRLAGAKFIVEVDNQYQGSGGPSDTAPPLEYAVAPVGGSSSSSSGGSSSSSSGGVVDSGTDGSEGGACTPAGAQCGAEFPVCCAGLSCEANGTMKTCQLPK